MKKIQTKVNRRTDSQWERENPKVLAMNERLPKAMISLITTVIDIDIPS